MSQRATTQDKMRIAVATGVSSRTVDRYFGGLKVTASIKQLIERACFELDIPTVSEVERG